MIGQINRLYGTAPTVQPKHGRNLNEIPSVFHSCNRFLIASFVSADRTRMKSIKHLIANDPVLSVAPLQKFPGYREEKKRCEYLHEKLSHIKQLITDYDDDVITHTSSCPSSS